MIAKTEFFHLGTSAVFAATNAEPVARWRTFHDPPVPGTGFSRLDMPLLRKVPFVRTKPPRDMRPEEEVFFCEATKEVFRDYEEFFQRTILCNSLVWSCSITGKSNLTYEEAVESERKAKKRLGTLPKPLKKGLLWLTHHTKRARLSDLVDDVYVFASNRYFRGMQ